MILELDVNKENIKECVKAVLSKIIFHGLEEEVIVRNSKHEFIMCFEKGFKKYIDFENYNIKNLNLGCGKLKFDDAIGIDIEDYGQELVWDLREGIPFPDETIQNIKAHHFLEHIERGKVIFVWQEMYRILVSEGILDIVVPHSTSYYAFIPIHLSYWNEGVIDFLCNGNYINTRFKVIEMERFTHNKEGDITLKCQLKKV